LPRSTLGNKLQRLALLAPDRLKAIEELADRFLARLGGRKYGLVATLLLWGVVEFF
jgi:hypothetical protein